MTKKDYELIANVIRQMWAFSDEQRYVIAEMFAVSFQPNNPRFDRTKFLQACGIETERKPYKGTQFEED